MKWRLKVVFYLKKGCEKKKGEVMIMGGMRIEGKVWELSRKERMEGEKWRISGGKGKGRDGGRIKGVLEEIGCWVNRI